VGSGLYASHRGEIHLSYGGVLAISWLSIARKKKCLPADKIPKGTIVYLEGGRVAYSRRSKHRMVVGHGWLNTGIGGGFGRSHRALVQWEMSHSPESLSCCSIRYLK